MSVNGMDLGQRGVIENVTTHRVTSEIIHSIYEIEQDAWSHGTGSYIGCSDCGEISSKTDVYGKCDTTLQKKTVSEIEVILGTGVPDCPCCSSSSTFHIYGEDYRDENIAARYDLSDSFLSVYRDASGYVRGFVNAYVSDLDTIYEREFDPYYNDNTKQILTKSLKENYQFSIENPLLSLNHMGADQSCVSLALLYNLLKTICTNIAEDFPHIDSIYDSILNNPIHGIHHAIGAEKLHMTEHLKHDVISDDFPVDMMFHQNGIESTLSNLGKDSRAFFREHLRGIKKIVNG